MRLAVAPVEARRGSHRPDDALGDEILAVRPDDAARSFSTSRSGRADPHPDGEEHGSRHHDGPDPSGVREDPVVRNGNDFDVRVAHDGVLTHAAWIGPVVVAASMFLSVRMRVRPSRP